MYSCKDQDVRGTLLLTRSDSDRWVIAAVRVLNSYVECSYILSISARILIFI